MARTVDNIISKTFYPLSVLYRALSTLDRKLSSGKTLPKIVISVGNITWGGTGKTPIVMKLAQDLVSRGLKPAVLSKGYFRKDKKLECVFVKDWEKILVSVDESGDEPYLIAQTVPGASVVVGNSRYKCGMAAIEKLNPDIFILDDGFQHWELDRDLDIVCVDVLNPFGNNELLPAGILREPISALNRADMVIITNAELADEKTLNELENKIKEVTTKEPLSTTYEISGFRNAATGQFYSPEEFKFREVIGVSSIGQNNGFRIVLEKNNYGLLKHFYFRDHHWYSYEDIKTITEFENSTAPVVTTSKDFIKLKGLLQTLDENMSGRFYIMEVQPKFIKGERIWEEKLKKLLASF
jgi:tetraacyldisaccharide 4'-kinase